MMVINNSDKDNSILFLAKRSPSVGIYFQPANYVGIYFQLARIIPINSAERKSPQFVMKRIDSGD